MKIHDISPLLSSQTAVFPGDRNFKREVALSFEAGHNLLLSSISTTLHLGAHADAPNHYSKEGVGISEVSLERYLGLAQVVLLKKNPGTRITADDIRNLKISAPRVLFKTLSFPNPNNWNNDFVSLSAGAIEELVLQKVGLVGMDTPSVDLADDKVLEAHNAIRSHGMSILEGLVLTDVPEGLYTLVALPLKIKDADASPVRAILIEKDLGIL